MDERSEAVCCRATSIRKLVNQIPLDILENEQLKASIDLSLPKNYDFEIQKTLWRIRQENAKHVGLQFPEGLLIFSNQIGAILSHFSDFPIDVTILGDVTYGACCIDDLTARSIGVDLLIHYGHSCLVPVDQTALKCLYVFVDIVFDFKPLVNAIVQNFPINSAPLFHDVMYDSSPVIVLMGTIQYSSVVHASASALREIYGHANIIVPQELPLTAGEVLGCTSPSLITESPTFCVFISDGRFHLESAMIQNPDMTFFRYDPFTKKLFREDYDHSLLHSNRKSAIERAKTARSVGIILGTLGRQGSVGIFEKLSDILQSRGIKTTLLLMSEILPDRLQKLSKSIDAFIQVACPRLSLDWGHFFGSTPLLTPYEACVAFGAVPYRDVYPMDYYSSKGGHWTNYRQEHRSGSLAAKFEASSLSDLAKRRALIRKRAEERRRNIS